MKKKIFVEDKEYFCIENIFEDKSPDEAIDKLIKFCHRFKENQDCKFTVDYDYYRVYLIYNRIETDEEYEKRLKKEQKANDKKVLAKNKREESERRQYERLKKKFEENKG